LEKYKPKVAKTPEKKIIQSKPTPVLTPTKTQPQDPYRKFHIHVRSKENLILISKLKGQEYEKL
jgi:hypothetical protein